MTQHLDAFDSPPEVRALDGEVLITGDLVSAAYTVKAARALILSLQAAVEQAEGAESFSAFQTESAQPAS
ncbi:MAG TPA: hypothetical protein VFF48_10820 [Brevundimonas sp.]|nr:hypothetical protein [Brevundimonas sp.]